MADIKELKKKLDVVTIIGSRIPLKPQGSAFVACCPFHDDKTPSWKLDDRQGDWLWKCFGCGKGGDVISFIEEFDHCDKKTAIEKLEAIASNKAWRDGAEATQKVFKPLEQSLSDKPKQTFTLEQWEPKVQALKNNQRALDWLKKERGLDDETIERMRLGYVQKHIFRIKEGMEHLREAGWVCFPRIEGEKIVAVKFRSVGEGKDSKAFSQVNNMDSRALFNIETINPIQPVYVTEGELDACVMEMLGFSAVSAPSAGVEISTESRVKLKLAERIFLAGDNDGGVGNEYMKKLARELGENTHILTWPDGCKDANDFFRGPGERNIEKMRKLIETLSKKAKAAPPEGFLSLIEALRQSDGTDMLNDPNRLHWPSSMPFADRMTFTPRGSVVLIYSTYTGTGKSMLKSQILLEEAKRGEIVADLSPEIRDEAYLALVTSQTVGPSIAGGLPRTGKVDRKHYLEAANRLEKPTLRGTDFRYYVGHSVLGQTEDEVLEFLENTIRALGVTRFAIDTFHRLVFAEGKLQTQAEGSMIKRIEALGIKYGTIFILICQSNAEAEGVENLKKNVHGVLRGSREIRDIPASIYLVHRNIRTQKEGENPDDILEKEAGLYAKKTRYKGPGYPQVKLMLQQENSLFVEQVGSGDPGPQEPPAFSEQSNEEIY